MQLENNNALFRKTPASQHAATPIRIAGGVFMLGIFLFALIGIRVAAAFGDPWIMWVPILLLALSGGIFISLAIRIARIAKNRKSEG